MGKGFKKFSRKLRVGAVLRALGFGLSVGLLLTAAHLLLSRLAAAELHIPNALLAAGVATLLGAGVMFLVLLPTRKRMARRMDRSLALGEKVQTMVAFRHDDSPMAALQRADTDRILSETPRRRVKGVCTWLFCLLPLLGCAALGGTLLVPAAEPDQPPPVVDNTFSFTPWQQQALRDLIETVKTSELEEEPREAVVKELESLLIQLKAVKKESTMRETVVASIVDIDTIVDEHNTYDLVALLLCNSPVDGVGELGNSILSLRTLLINDTLDSLRESMKGDEGMGDPAAVASTLASGIGAALKTNTTVPATNGVITALEGMAAALEGVSEAPAEGLQDVLDALFSEWGGELNNALYIQATNEQVGFDTVYSLMSIFGIQRAEVPESIFQKPDGSTSHEGDYDDKPSDDDTLHGGGLGTGEMIYGSNDMIYDPVTDRYVVYGEVLGDYYARITAQLVDGKLPEDLEAILTDYFAFLFDGSDKD